MRFFSVKMPAMRHPGQKTRMKQRRLHTNQSIVPDKAVCLHRQWGICCNLGKLLQSFRLDTSIDLFSLPKWGKAKRVSQHLPRFGLWWSIDSERLRERHFSLRTGRAELDNPTRALVSAKQSYKSVEINSIERRFLQHFCWSSSTSKGGRYPLTKTGASIDSRSHSLSPGESLAATHSMMRLLVDLPP